MAELVPSSSSGIVDRVVETLVGGGVVALPTDTVYGLVALPESADAVAKIFALKQRPDAMHLPVLVAHGSQLPLVSSDERTGVAVIAEVFWPGALTLVVKEPTALVAGLGADDGTVGVRCPDYDLVRAVALAAGPLAATSANLHGMPTPVGAAGVAVMLPGIDLVVDGGPCARGQASTVIDLTGSDPTLLRAGPVDFLDVELAWTTA